MLALVLSACGPESSSTEQSTLARTTQAIATDYQASRDLAAARTELQALDVANVNQWIIYTTETAIEAGEAVATTNALVTLAIDLGLQSNVIESYASQNGLSPATANSSDSGIAQLNRAENNDTTATVLVPIPNVANNVANSGALAEGGNANAPEPQAIQIEPEPTAVDSAPGDVEAEAGLLAEDNTAEDNTAESDTEADLEADAENNEPAEAPAVEPTATANTQPSVLATTGINVRSGPGVEYEIAGALAAGERAQIAGKNPAADWWEIIMPSGRQGWVYSPLVQTTGNVDAVAVAANIPTPPPPTPTSPPAPTAAPVAEEPAATATPKPAPVAAGPTFRVAEKRLWDVVENGGRLDGPSVTCGEKRQLVVRVIDAAGNPLNGVAVQAIYGAQEIFVSGHQGKGDGIAEFVLGGGQAVKVVRDVDGSEVSSEEAHNLSTKPWEIPFETLIGGRFCTDTASCQSFVDATGCYGHYSWTVTFQRSY